MKKPKVTQFSKSIGVGFFVLIAGVGALSQQPTATPPAAAPATEATTNTPNQAQPISAPNVTPSVPAAPAPANTVQNAQQQGRKPMFVAPFKVRYEGMRKVNADVDFPTVDLTTFHSKAQGYKNFKLEEMAKLVREDCKIISLRYRSEVYKKWKISELENAFDTVCKNVEADLTAGRARDESGKFDQVYYLVHNLMDGKYLAFINSWGQTQIAKAEEHYKAYEKTPLAKIGVSYRQSQLVLQIALLLSLVLNIVVLIKVLIS